MKKTKKYVRLDEKRPYKKKFKCQNPGCKGLTDCPAWNEGKLNCQKCLLYRRNHFNKFPTPKMVQQLKEVGLWKK